MLVVIALPSALLIRRKQRQNGIAGLCRYSWTRPVRELLDRVFPERWIGHGGPIFYVPRSPDLTPSGFLVTSVWLCETFVSLNIRF
ncbi:hypothetical protein AVEN_160973-1 [Araneus ventricosus]|uniref:Uncharacterized protein n=1 Tax=Araneus ventricosus TaxID=182803 RepID=A0A4Y2TRH8_ARAVE|nr:hypothetical protein AVEN_160973-1 [Araneus ventricosus]